MYGTSIAPKTYQPLPTLTQPQLRCRLVHRASTRDAGRRWVSSRRSTKAGRFPPGVGPTRCQRSRSGPRKGSHGRSEEGCTCGAPARRGRSGCRPVPARVRTPHRARLSGGVGPGRGRCEKRMGGGRASQEGVGGHGSERDCARGKVRHAPPPSLSASLYLFLNFLMRWPAPHVRLDLGRRCLTDPP